MILKSLSGKLHLVMAGASAAALMHASVGHAQDNANPAPASTGTADTGFEEIVVTAQKRSENIRDVPISITALAPKDLEKTGITNIGGLTAVVPGLKIDRVGAVFLPSIRGISTLTTTAGAEPNVSTYVDNIYMGTGQAAGTIQQLADISRINVLKGPQGTLFGRNSTGGAIQIFTRDPNMGRLEGEASVRYGNYDDLTFKAFVSAPIIADKIAVSVSGYRQTADSYNKNLTPNIPLQDIENWTVRGKILITPTDNTRILLTGVYGENADPSSLLFTPLDGLTIGKGIPGSIVPTRPYEVASSVPIPLKQRLKMASFEVNQKTPIGDFTLLGSYLSTLFVSSTTTGTGFAPPAPFTGANYTGEGGGAGNIAKSAEIDFASKKFGGFSFVAGANYYRVPRARGQSYFNIVTSLPSASSAISNFGGQTSKTWAVFGEATYDLTDRLSLVGGLRYTHEDRGVYGALLPGIIQVAPPLYDWGTETFRSTTHKLAVRYEVSSDTNAYFTYSTGFRSGNFNNFSIPFGQTPTSCAAANATAPGSCPLPVAVRPEKITAYEIGVKSAPLPWMRVDAALFAYKLSDIQVLAFSNVCLAAPCPPNPTTPLGTLSNAAGAETYGAEVSIDARVTDELRVQAGISILDATFTDYDNTVWNVPAPGGLGLASTPITSATGKQVPRSPKATLTATATYTKDLPAGELSLSANGYATKRFYFDIGNVFYQPSYATLGLNASFSPSAVPGLTVSAWGNNLTNNSVILSTFLNAFGALASYAPPRTYGVTLGYKF
jgi:iron complex outermembrane recepter protein